VNRVSERNFHRLYRGLGPPGTGALVVATLEVTTSDDYPNNTTTSYTLYNCREKKVKHDGELNHDTITSQGKTTWQIPQQSLDNAGAPIPKLSDNIIGPDGQRWNIVGMPKQLMGDCWNAHCQRVF